MEEITQEIEIEDAEEKKEDAIEELLAKDVTPDLEIRAEAEEEKEEEIKEKKKEPHGLTELLNMAINYTDEHARKLRAKGIEVPEVNMPLWENFGKPLLNQAFWHYFPDTDGLDDPRLALLAGGAVTTMAVAPTLLGIVRYYRAENEKRKKRTIEKKETEEEQKAEEVKTEKKEKTPRDILKEAWK